jgi:sugar/nucleoside kinase (ribokinase family)
VPPSVQVIGDALLDVHVTPPAPLEPGSDRPAEVRLEPGGQGANLAVRLARRGVPVRLTCALADDTAGAMVRAALRADGVEVDARESPMTGVVVALIDADGDRTMLSQRVPLLDGDHPRHEVSWTVISGYVLLEPGASRLPALVDLSQRRAVAGCAITPAQVEGWSSALRALAPDLLVLNRDEAGMLAGAETVAVVVVVTDAEGATATIDGRTIRVDAPAGEPATDTTGAGDAFFAAFLADLLDKAWPPSEEALEAAMHAATRLASAVARSRGAQARVLDEPPATLST